MNYATFFQKLGLSKNEASVYIAMLKKGEGKPKDIAIEAGLPRTTVYPVLERLAEMNYVTPLKQKGVKKYEAVNPQHIFMNLQENEFLFQKALPDLQKLMWTATMRPNVRVFEKKEGMIMVLEELLEEGKRSGMMYTIGVLDIFTVLPRYFPRFVEKRIKNKTPQRAIVYEDAGALAFQKKSESELRQVKILPAKYGITTDETVCGNKIFAFPIKNEEIAMIIESKELANTKRQMFEFLWDHL